MTEETTETGETKDGLAGFRERKLDVGVALQELGELADGLGAKSLRERVQRDLVRKLEEDRFHLVVVGEFNHGKSSFVNALLEKEALPVGVTPTTAAIHHLCYADKPEATVVYTSGKRESLPFDQVRSFAVGGEREVTDEIDYLEVGYPAPLLRERILLVDTPGVNDLSLQRADITYSYIPRADAVLFLLDAGQILKESERAFLANKLLAQSRDKVLFVINKIDLLDESEREEALNYARTQLAKLVKEPRVYAVSAEKALGGDREGSGLMSLVADLTKFLAEDRGRVLLDNALDEGLRTAVTLRRGIEVQKQALALDQGELEKRLRVLEEDLSSSAEAGAKREAKIRQDLAAIKALVRKECDDFGKRFSSALPAEIESSKADDLKRYLPGFMEERFRSFADKQGLEIARRMEKVAEEAIAFISDEARARGEKIADAFPGTPRVDLNVNTLAYDVGVIALGAFGLTLMALSNLFVGGALLGAAPILAYVFRGRADRETKKRALEEAPAAIEKAAKELATAFERQIDEFGDKLVDFVKGASEEVTRSMAEVVRHASHAKAEGEGETLRVREEAGMALARLGAVEQKMGALRTALWANGTGTGGEGDPQPN